MKCVGDIIAANTIKVFRSVGKNTTIQKLFYGFNNSAIVGLFTFFLSLRDTAKENTKV